MGEAHGLEAGAAPVHGAALAFVLIARVGELAITSVVGQTVKHVPFHRLETVSNGDETQ